MKNQKILFLIMSLCCSISFGQGTLTTLPHTVNHSVHSIHFSDEMNGWMSGQDGAVYRTNDGGITWLDVSTNYYLPFCQIHSWDNMNALISSSQGFLIRTSDGGATWDSISIPNSYQLLEMKFKSDSVGYLVDFYETYKTVDGGYTWSLLLADYSRSLYFDSYRECIGGSSGEIYMSTDNGVSFNTIDTDMPNSVKACAFANADVGVALDGNGGIARTVNGGLTWTWSQQQWPYEFWGAELLYGGRGYAIYSNVPATLYQTDDHGLNWFEVGNYSCSGMRDMSFPSKCVGYICTLNGVVIKYEDVACDSLANLNDLSETSFNYYPNPTTDKISFNRTVSQVCVLNSNGQILKEFNNVKSIDVQDLAPGIYILSIDEQFYRVVKQ